MTFIQSDILEAVHYDAEAQTLAARLRCSEKVVVYEDVPQQVYDSLLFADSIGDFFASQIQGRYNAHER